MYDYVHLLIIMIIASIFILGIITDVGRGGRVVERRTFGRGTWVQNHLLRRFEASATSFTPLCLCLLVETVKAVGPFYLVPICQGK